MADQLVPQGVVGSPIRRNEPRPAAPSGEPVRQPSGSMHDAVPEFIESGVTADRQSRRYAHTMRRGEVSAPIPTGEAVSAPVRDDAASAPVQVSDVMSTPVRASDVMSAPVRASDVMSAPVRASDVISAPARVSEVVSAPVRAGDAAGSTIDALDVITNRASAPSDSTALYRKRTNPTLPVLSPDLIARPQPVSDSPEDDAAIDAAIDATMDHGPSPPGPEDAPSALPAVMLDAPASSGLAMRPLTLPRPPVRLLLSIVAAALVVVGLWMLRLAF